MNIIIYAILVSYVALSAFALGVLAYYDIKKLWKWWRARGTRETRREAREQYEAGIRRDQKRREESQ